jgi:hypothetical protein
MTHKNRKEKSMIIGLDLGALLARRPKPPGLVFDDEPLEAILYGEASPGPTAPIGFAAAHAEGTAILGLLAAGRHAEGVERAVNLLEGTDAVPLETLASLSAWLGAQIPETPWPRVRDPAIDYGRMLRPLYRRSGELLAGELRGQVAIRLYRWLEAAGGYAEAREVILELLGVARRQRRAMDEAALTNNLGYEYLMEGNWEAAQPWFEKAERRFGILGLAVEVANVASNGLICRFERLGAGAAEPLRPRIEAVLGVLEEASDWRRRKPLILLARLEAQCGHLRAAIRLAQRAVTATRGLATLHRRHDQRYLWSLRRKLRRLSRAKHCEVG